MLRVLFIHGLEGSPQGLKARALAAAFAAETPAMDTADPEACLAQQAAAIARVEPDVVVGSSFGGALLLALIQQGAWRGPSLFLAQAAGRRPELLAGGLPPDVAALVVHGRRDDVIDPADSRRLAGTGSATRVRHLEVDDDHRLASLVHSGQLVELVREVHALGAGVRVTRAKLGADREQVRLHAVDAGSNELADGQPAAGEHADAPLTWRQVLARLRAEPAFRRVLNEAVVASPYAALRWETPPLARDAQDPPFAFVALDSPALARAAAEPGPFAEHLAADAPVVDFPNLGGDAQLVVPTPQGPEECYTHLAAFCRAAPAAQVDAFWQRVGDALAARLAASPAPVWVSTAGLGVHWVHLRLDSRPKYYHHAPYRSPPRG